MNFLEQLVAEWFAHQGYLVKTNHRFGPRKNGGYDGEMDVIALRLPDRELVHVETSSDGVSWAERTSRVNRKFANAEQRYADVFGAEFKIVRRVAVVGIGRPKVAPTFEKDIELLSIDDVMREIKTYVAGLDPVSDAVPELYPRLRAVQFAVWFAVGVGPRRTQRGKVE